MTSIVLPIHMDEYRLRETYHDVSPSSLSPSSALSESSVESGSSGSSGSSRSSATSYSSRSSIRRNPSYQKLHDASSLYAPSPPTVDRYVDWGAQRHPRRTSPSKVAPPALLRQSERKAQFVDNVVDCATVMVEKIWPLSAPAFSSLPGQSKSSDLPLRTFIQETLKRSKTSFSTLQVALYYLVLVKPFVPSFDFTMEQPVDSPSSRALQCGRRMFLAALILASKYLQDRNYSARAWSRITSLEVCEINTIEIAFLLAIDWKLHVPESLFERWQSILIAYSPPHLSGSWKALVGALSPSLEVVPELELHQIHLDRCARRAPLESLSMPRFTADYPAFGSPLCSSPVVTRPCGLDASEPYALQAPPAPPHRKLPTPRLPELSRGHQLSSVCAPPAASGTNSQSAMACAWSVARNTGYSRSVLDNMSRHYSRQSISEPFGSARNPMSPPETPASLMSDRSSLSSRSSSVSSASMRSPPSTLYRLATQNASNQKIAIEDWSSIIAEHETVTILESDPLTESPDEMIVPAISPIISTDDAVAGRKRARGASIGSSNPTLQQAVSDLLRRPSSRFMAHDARPPMHAALQSYSGAKPVAKRPCVVGWGSWGELR